jgi:phosphatidylserine decarboxylase
VLGTFCRLVGADVGEAEHALEEYARLDDFFVRRLKPGVRSFPEDPHVVVSPVDGTLAEHGMIEGNLLLQVKGIRYSSADLLDDPDEAARYDGGSFITIYLSPKDYHRIHAPCDGELDWARHVPGRLLPVNPPSVALVPDLFARNERLACALHGSAGRVAVVAVAALNVGRISSEFDPSWNGPRGGVCNRRRAVPTTRRYDPAEQVPRGSELMAFHLGSTVVILLERDRFQLRPGLDRGALVRLGEPLADLVGAI